ncbi:MAG: type I DNA topoisomerase [Brevinema sp.]
MPVAKKPAKKTTKKLTTLVIVESPSKAETLKKYLGSGYTVKASAGHVIDLPKSTIGVDLTTFEPRYIVMRDRSKVMKDLVEAVKNAKQVLLASDPDREGEAIAAHLKNYFNEKIVSKLKRELPIQRIRFAEITKDAVLKAVSMPTEITQPLVHAQQGRRVVDRLFGYELSPLLWKKVKGKLSAGRVQSTALRIIVDRENEINSFVSQEYWVLEAQLAAGKDKIKATLSRWQGKRLVSPGDLTDENKQVVIRSQEEMDILLKTLEKSEFTLKETKTSRTQVKASPPFITSTLQQAANNLLGWAAAKTMRTAQELYEGLDIGTSRTGLITYMRTDSTRLSPVALAEADSYITQNYGKEYLPASRNVYGNKKSSQDAHEAIRPTSAANHPDAIKNYLSADQFKLYNLIWRRFMSSQMAAAERETDSVIVEAGEALFSASGSRIIFDGFQKVWNLGAEKKESKIPVLKEGAVLNCQKLEPEQKFTQPPARYSEAALVKLMEELGIGRPSTYAPTIMTLTKRYYVKKSGRTLIPTDLGKAVNKLLVENFSSLIDAAFTAKLEESLDAVEEQGADWKTIVRDFYIPFHQTVAHAYEHVDSIKGAFDEKTNEICEVCGRPMVKKLGKFGYFIACSGWPDCTNAKPVPYGACPKCATGKVVEKRGGRRGAFYACNTYPTCDFLTNSKISEKICPKDGTPLFYQNKNTLVCLKEGCGHTEAEE